MTFTDIDAADPTRAEVDFTVVAQPLRGGGLGGAVKAYACLDLVRQGVRVFRTGGSDDNPASLRANLRLGFVVDERWLTLAPPD